MLETINGGDLLVDGLSVKGDAAQVREIRREAGMVFQQFNLFPQMTALENVMFGPVHTRGMGRDESRKLAQELLGKVGLAERMNHYPSELSGGQQQRVAIARALAIKPKLMLFDEPTSALDPELRHEVLKVMKDLAEEGMTMVVVTHEMEFARKVGSRLIFIDGGKVAHDGPPTELLGNPPSQRLRISCSTWPEHCCRTPARAGGGRPERADIVRSFHSGSQEGWFRPSSRAVRPGCSCRLAIRRGGPLARSFIFESYVSWYPPIDQTFHKSYDAFLTTTRLSDARA